MVQKRIFNFMFLQREKYPRILVVEGFVKAALHEGNKQAVNAERSK